MKEFCKDFMGNDLKVGDYIETATNKKIGYL